MSEVNQGNHRPGEGDVHAAPLPGADEPKAPERSEGPSLSPDGLTPMQVASRHALWAESEISRLEAEVQSLREALEALGPLKAAAVAFATQPIGVLAVGVLDAAKTYAEALQSRAAAGAGDNG